MAVNLDAAPQEVETPRSELRSHERAVKIGLIVARLGPALSLILLILIMWRASPYFLTVANLRNVGGQVSILGSLAVGELVVIITAGIDLSVGAVVILTGVVGAMAARAAGGGPDTAWLVILVGVGAGVVVGFCNGVAYVYGRVPHPFIVTLASLGIVTGVSFLLTHGNTLTTVPPFILKLGDGLVLGFPVPVLLASGVALLVAYLLRTQWGRWVYAVGANAEAARRMGVPTRKVVISVYVLSGTCAAIAGLITMGRQASASPLSNGQMELDAITAVIIGGASFFGGRGSVGNVVVGSLILVIIQNGIDLLDVSAYWQYVASGVVVLVAIELDVFRGYLENRLRVMHAVAHDDP